MSPLHSGATTFAGRAKKRIACLCALAFIAAAMLVFSLALLPVDAQQQPAFSLPAIDPPARQAKTPPAPAETRQQAQTDGQQAASAADLQTPPVARDCADLLQMATALKQEVDKTTPDTLSVTVVRQAAQIEQLARKVRLGSGKS